MPEATGPDADRARHALGVFDGPFQDRQRNRRYRPVPERSASIVGQLDAFLYDAFGTLSVTIEVSRPGWWVLAPDKLFNVFWISNPPDPARWAENDVPAAAFALVELLGRTGGTTCWPVRPELADRIPD